jgi:hypothetical protein
MPRERGSIVTLMSLGGMAAIAGACEHFGLGAPDASRLAAGSRFWGGIA